MKKKNKISFDVNTTSKYPIVVDGETEKWYFEMLKRNEPSLRIEIKPELSNKKSLKDQYELVRDLLDKEYSKVFWIIDLDVIIKETKECKKGKLTPIECLASYIDKLDKYNNNNRKKNTNKAILIINNPCLEFWILLHYSETTKYFGSCETVTKELKKYLKDYEKKKDYYRKQNNDIYIKLKDNLKQAINNSKSIGGFNKNLADKSFSEMYKFFYENPFKKHFELDA